jgi:hypothetical protein
MLQALVASGVHRIGPVLLPVIDPGPDAAPWSAVIPWSLTVPVTAGRMRGPTSGAPQPVPSHFPESEQNTELTYTLYNFSAGEDAAEGRWASGSTPDGRGQFTYLWLCRSSMSPSERPSP